MHRAIVVRRPAHEREDRTGTEGDDFRAAAEDALGCNTAEADPLLEAPFDPGQFDLREAAVRRTDRRRITTNRRSINRIRSEEHTSELQSLMRNSYAVFCFKKKRTEPITTV